MAPGMQRKSRPAQQDQPVAHRSGRRRLFALPSHSPHSGQRLPPPRRGMRPTICATWPPSSCGRRQRRLPLTALLRLTLQFLLEDMEDRGSGPEGICQYQDMTHVRCPWACLRNTPAPILLRRLLRECSGKV